MFCSRCGTEIDSEPPFCPTCGLDLRTTTPGQAAASGDVSELDIIREALQSEYELIEELGRGGMAIVFRAREKQLEREVAVKVLPFSLAFDAEFVERFQREARTAAQLEHPNIIPIYRVGKSGRVIYFVMKLLRGSSLSRVLMERKKLPPAEIRTLLVQVGRALAYAHQRGIVHRDIKPDNVMFDEFGHCLVTDFGIAKAVSSSRLTGTGMSIGTPHYMSPEQARAQAIDGRSDIYSLGIVAYQALVGEVPYDGEDSFSIGYKHIMEPIPVPLLDTSDERRLFEIIRRMMMKDPFDRYQTAEELVSALEGQPQQQIVPARRISAAQAVAASQPTTPLPAASPRPSPAVSVGGGSGSSAGPVIITPRRPVMRRSSTTQPPTPSGSFGWLLVLFFILLFGLGGFLAWRSGLLGGRSPADSARTSPGPAAPRQGAVTPPVSDSTVSVPSRRPATEEPRAVPAATGRPPSDANSGRPEQPTDSGSLRISGNLPPRTTVLIDSRPVTQQGDLIRIPAGHHEIAIGLPNRPIFVDSIEIEAGGTLVLTPEVIPDAAPLRPGIRRLREVLNCDIATRANRFGAACYDQRPTPLRSQVPLGPDIHGTPSQAVLLVQVSAEGQTLVLRVYQPSNDSAFTAQAVEFARTVRWNPALKDGRPVVGWTQWPFTPEVP
jgi:serine/threonine-protein kinase